MKLWLVVFLGLLWGGINALESDSDPDTAAESDSDPSALEAVSDDSDIAEQGMESLADEIKSLATAEVMRKRFKYTKKRRTRQLRRRLVKKSLKSTDVSATAAAEIKTFLAKYCPKYAAAATACKKTAISTKGMKAAIEAALRKRGSVKNAVRNQLTKSMKPLDAVALKPGVETAAKTARKTWIGTTATTLSAPWRKGSKNRKAIHQNMKRFKKKLTAIAKKPRGKRRALARRQMRKLSRRKTKTGKKRRRKTKTGKKRRRKTKTGRKRRRKIRKRRKTRKRTAPRKKRSAKKAVNKARAAAKAKRAARQLVRKQYRAVLGEIRRRTAPTDGKAAVVAFEQKIKAAFAGKKTPAPKTELVRLKKRLVTRAAAIAKRKTAAAAAPVATPAPAATPAPGAAAATPAPTPLPSEPAPAMALPKLSTKFSESPHVRDISRHVIEAALKEYAATVGPSVVTGLGDKHWQTIANHLTSVLAKPGAVRKMIAVPELKDDRAAARAQFGSHKLVYGLKVAALKSLTPRRVRRLGLVVAKELAPKPTATPVPAATSPAPTPVVATPEPKPYDIDALIHEATHRLQEKYATPAAATSPAATTMPTTAAAFPTVSPTQLHLMQELQAKLAAAHATRAHILNAAKIRAELEKAEQLRKKLMRAKELHEQLEKAKKSEAAAIAQHNAIIVAKQMELNEKVMQHQLDALNAQKQLAQKVAELKSAQRTKILKMIGKYTQLHKKRTDAVRQQRLLLLMKKKEALQTLIGLHKSKEELVEKLNKKRRAVRRRLNTANAEMRKERRKARLELRELKFQLERSRMRQHERELRKRGRERRLRRRKRRRADRRRRWSLMWQAKKYKDDENKYKDAQTAHTAAQQHALAMQQAELARLHAHVAHLYEPIFDSSPPASNSTMPAPTPVPTTLPPLKPVSRPERQKFIEELIHASKLADERVKRVKQKRLVTKSLHKSNLRPIIKVLFKLRMRVLAKMNAAQTYLHKRSLTLLEHQRKILENIRSLDRKLKQEKLALAHFPSHREMREYKQLKEQTITDWKRHSRLLSRITNILNLVNGEL